MEKFRMVESQLSDVDNGQDCAMLALEEKETAFGSLTFTEDDEGKGKVKPYLLGKSVALYASFLSLGLINAVVGPTLVSMEILLDTDAATIARTLMGNGIGYLTGAVVCALCFDRFNPEIQFTLAMVVQGSCMAAAPFTGNVYAYMVMCSLCAVGSGFIDSGGNSYAITLWKRHKFKGPLLQGIHAVWSIGATLGPIIVRPFLVNLNTEQFNTTNVTSLPPGQSDVEFTRYAYVTISSISLMCACVYFVLLILQRPPCLASTPKLSKNTNPESNTEGQLTNRCHIVTLLFILFIYFHAIVFVEGCTGNFIAPFVVKHLGWTNRDSALIAAALQGALGIGRVVNIPVSAFLSPRVVLTINLSVTLIAYILACFLSYGDIILWVSVVMAGFFQSSTFPTSILWASNYLQVSGKASGLFLVGASSPSFIYPNLVGTYFDNGTPMYMLYTTLTVAIIQMLVFVCMQSFALYAFKKEEKLRKRLEIDRNT